MMYAKVSLQSVRAFKLPVQEVGEYSKSLGKGIACVDDIKAKMGHQIGRIDGSIVRLSEARMKLSIIIKELQAKIAVCIAEINTLRAELVALSAELAITPPIIITTDSDGKLVSVSNPRYEDLKDKIDDVQSKIDEAERKKQELQDRLNKAERIAGEILSHIDSSNGMISALKEKQKTCDQMHYELDDIRAQNAKKSAAVSETLSKIEKIVKSYMGIKLKYEDVKRQSAEKGNGKGINISLSINHSIQHNEQVILQTVDSEKKQTQDFVKEHGVEFDGKGRICKFDGKSFGGQYNSYDDRLNNTPVSDDPVLGYYQGERGESKFIPSNRNAKGIVVIGILERYGIDGINYMNGEPDFEVCSEAVVKISSMTENRYDYSNSDGMPSLGNFTQADIECARLWNKQEKDGKSDWGARDVKAYREEHGLTWHEKCDTETMVLVSWEINDYFKHSGGCSECRTRDSVVTGRRFDE